jgi:hypothetical protein
MNETGQRSAEDCVADIFTEDEEKEGEQVCNLCVYVDILPPCHLLLDSTFWFSLRYERGVIEALPSPFVRITFRATYFGRAHRTLHR